jgi:rhodanese-related sulfurtransferase
MREIMIDVRERDEFEAEHVENSINVPLSHFSTVALGVLNPMNAKQVRILCRSGNRAKLALDQIKQLGYSDKIQATVYEGGILEWKRQGHPTIAKKKNHLPILRQVQILVGTTVLVTSLGGAFFSPWLLIISAFFGAGLAFAGVTGFCGMANLLALMPWNKTQPSKREELCQISPSSSCCS